MGILGVTLVGVGAATVASVAVVTKWYLESNTPKGIERRIRAEQHRW